jgi:hypothetical protein
MVDLSFLENLNPLVQAFLATCFTWGLTALGAGFVFLTKGTSRNVLGGMLGSDIFYPILSRWRLALLLFLCYI